MSWDYSISERALKQFQKLDKQASKQILGYLDDHISGTEDPRQWGKQLKGELNNVWRYPCDNYHVLCQLQNEMFIVMGIEVAYPKGDYK